jgi:hypothetical protein
MGSLVAAKGFLNKWPHPGAMTGPRVHFEVFVRRTPGARWSLELATEDRAQAIAAAHEQMDSRKVAAARVNKETLDENTREFRAVTILALGAAETKKSKIQERLEPLCVQPQDLYTLHARQRIGEVLEEWLDRHGATPFELLHRPDLIGQLEAADGEVQHAIQKIAVPDAQARGMSVHELIRAFNVLVDRSIERVLRDAKKNAFPDLAKEGFGDAVRRLSGHAEAAYLLGGGVAQGLASCVGWSAKVTRLIDYADDAPREEAARALALSVIEPPLAEIIGAKAGLDDLLGEDLDLGGNLAALTRLAASSAVDMLIRIEPSVAKVMPPLSPAAQRLSRWLAESGFADLRTALGKRILRELNGPRRLRPGDPEGEIVVLRGLAMALTAAAGKLLPLEDVQSAFTTRSRMMLTNNFVEAYLTPGRPAREEAQALIWLTENIIGAANKRQAARWLSSTITSLRFEREALVGDDAPSARLAALAVLQRAAGRCGLVEEDRDPLQLRIGRVGGLIEDQAKLTAALARANAPLVQRMTLLLRLAAGETAPLGPAADRARDEALKLLRRPDAREALTQAPDKMVTMRDLMQQAGLAA